MGYMMSLTFIQYKNNVLSKANETNLYKIYGLLDIVNSSLNKAKYWYFYDNALFFKQQQACEHALKEIAIETKVCYNFYDLDWR